MQLQERGETLTDQKIIYLHRFWQPQKGGRERSTGTVTLALFRGSRSTERQRWGDKTYRVKKCGGGKQEPSNHCACMRKIFILNNTGFY